ncbi:glycosyltransferase [bacterium]|nr:glycosyltransferase [bacterium]
MARGVPLVSYVLVNWRTEELLPRALQSILDQTYQMREVILVNNGSTGFDDEALGGFAPLTIISNERNRGFAAANNQGIAASSGDVIVLLNCDAYLDKEFTERTIGVLTSNPRIGSVVPKLLADDESGRIDSTGHVMHTDRTPASRGKGEQDQGQYDAGGYVFGGTAAAIAYRREMLERVAEGGEVFDESFFAYYEDVDLDWRANLAGFRAYYEPRCIAYHRGHASGGRKNLAIRLRAEKNRYLMLAKNDTLRAQLGALVPIMLYEAWHGLAVLLQPWLWPAIPLLLWHLPGAWAKRWRARSQRVIPAGRIAESFVARGLRPPPKSEPAAGLDKPLLEKPGEGGSGAGTAQEERAVFPLVSIVVVNYNGLHLTRACLRALAAQTYEPLEVIVVDNGSAVDEAGLLAVEFPSVRTLRLPRNHGFAGGVNWGASLAQGEWLMLINNDCVPDADCVRNLLYAARRSGAPAVSGRLVDIADRAPPEDVAQVLAALRLAQDPDASQAGGLNGGAGILPAAWRPGMAAPPHLREALLESARNHGVSHFGYRVDDAYMGRDECFYPSGGLCLLSREILERHQPELLPHSYFAYAEDKCLGYRIRAAGGWVAKEPRAAAVHLASSTGKRLGRARLRFLMERNRMLNLLAFTPAWVLWRLAPVHLLVNMLAGLHMLGKPPGDFFGWAAANIWLATHIPTVLRWRTICRAQATVPDEQWLCELSGQLRGKGRLLNRLALHWCRLNNIPCREHR